MRAILLIPLLLLAACGAPEVKLERLPAVEGAAGEVWLIRPTHWIGEEAGYVVNVDQRDIHTLEMKQHIRVRLAPGEHRVALRCYQPLSNSWKETVINQQVQAGATTYLEVEPRGDCASLEPRPEAEGKRLAARTAFRPL